MAPSYADKRDRIKFEGIVPDLGGDVTIQYYDHFSIAASLSAFLASLSVFSLNFWTSK